MRATQLVAVCLFALIYLSESHSRRKTATLSRTRRRPDYACPTTDILIVVDVSRSIHKKDFKKVKEFLVKFLEHVPISEHKVRIGVVKFATKVEFEFKLGDPSNKDAVIKKVKEMDRDGFCGGSNVGGGIEKARHELHHHGRKHQRHVMLVVTDGHSNKGPDPVEQAQKARNHGTITVAVGVGKHINTEEIRGIAGERHRAVTFESFHDLPHEGKNVAKKICEDPCPQPPPPPPPTIQPPSPPPPPPPTTTTTTTPPPTTTTTTTTPEPTTTTTTTTTPPPTTTTTTTTTPAPTTTTTTTPTPTTTTTTTPTPTTTTTTTTTTLAPVCTDKLDLVFVMDCSCSIKTPKKKDKTKNFKIMKNFMRNVLEILTVGADTTHVGLVKYSKIALESFSMTKYLDRGDILNAIQNFDHTMESCGTNTEDGMKKGKVILDSEGRKGVSKVMVVMTDGNHHQGAPPGEIAEKIRGDGVTTIAVGISKKIDMDELIGIGGGKDQVLTADNFKALSSQVKNLATTICETPKTKPKPAY